MFPSMFGCFWYKKWLPVTQKTLSPKKYQFFAPKTTKFGHKIGIFGQFGPGHVGLFSALLVGRLVVVARGLYLARHLFTLLSFKMRGNVTSDHFLMLWFQKGPLDTVGCRTFRRGGAWFVSPIKIVES